MPYRAVYPFGLAGFPSGCYRFTTKLKFNQEQLGRFCRERGISRLELFGSALNENFRDKSDVDLLATLREDARPTLLEWAEI